MNISEFEKLNIDEKISFLKNNKKEVFRINEVDLLINIIYENHIYDYLFDSNGVNTLFYMPYKVQEVWLNSIMNSSAKNSLLKNKYICMYIIDSIKKEYEFDFNLNINDNKYFYDYILNHHYVNDLNLFLTIAFMSDNDSKEYLLSNYPQEKKLNYLPDLTSLNPKNLEWVLSNYKINLEDYSFDTLYELSLGKISIPTFLFENIDFLNKVNCSNDIAVSRKIINDLSINSDTSIIEKHREKVFDNYLKTYNDGMFENYYLFYNDLIKIKYNEKVIDKLVNKYFRQDNRVFKDKIKNLMYYNPNKNQIKRFLINYCNNYVSNMIIDYHFKDVYYDALINLKQMLDFQEKNKTFSDNKIDFYNKIINIDLLDFKEKIALHEYLKEYDIVRMFYDDMFSCRNVMASLIKDNILSKEKLNKYKNEKLSVKNGVDIYILDGEEFYAIAKTGEHHEKDNPYARSYSILGNNATSVYDGGGYSSDAFLYDGLTSEQIVHMFPTDSFTKYDRNLGSTNRVNVLMDPETLVLNTDKYNEVLILEKGNIKSEMDERIPRLSKIALYTYDELKEKDLEVAKEEGIGIVIIKRKKYNKTKEKINYDGLKYYESNSQNNLDKIRSSITR